MECDTIEVNSYIILQRHGYFKLHQLVNNNSTVMLGKDRVNLKNIVGKPYWTMFKMVSNGKKREFDLVECSKMESLSEEILKAVSYGVDNRNITDDGSSQKLSSEEITEMRESGVSGQEIVEKIVENSKTFKEKTEYSQEKYLKKKEKKYFEFIIIRKPTLRLLADIFYSRDQLKIMAVRHDTLAQIFNATNIQHDGVYALFESGSQALVAAGILSYLSDNGLLVNLTLGTTPQKQAVLSMNFSKEKLRQVVYVKMREFFSTLFSKEEKKPTCDESSLTTNGNGPEQSKLDSTNLNSSSNEKCVPSDSVKEVSDNVVMTTVTDAVKSDKTEVVEGATNKRKLSSDESVPSKKPRWAEDFERAIEAFTIRKLNGIVIVAKEYPLNIIEKLLQFLKPSCQLVVYCGFREPIVQLYLDLRKRKDVIGVRITDSWLRTYQVLPDRTHPDVNMSFSGHVLIATKVI